MKRISTLFLGLLFSVFLVSSSAACWLPPKKYDYEPRIPYVVRYAYILPQAHGIAEPPMVVGDPWIIYIDPRTPLGVACVLRHEKGHVNGWHHPEPEH